jgi:fluoride exporter
MLQKLLLLALAGGAGTITRFGLTGLAHRIAGAGFPFGTLVVNIFGCFLSGFFWSLFEHRWPVTGNVRVIVLIGFMGAFTTYSTYILETGHLLRDAAWLHALGNILLQNILGFAALFLGLTAGRYI